MQLGNMPPSISTDNITNIRPVDTVFGGKFFLRGAFLRISAANLSNLCLCQFAIVASLCRLVLHIVGVGAKEQMCRIDARGIVALVTNAHVFWNGTVMQFVAIAMGENHFAVNVYRSISVECAVASPQPAINRFVDLRPKAFNSGARAAMSMQEVKRLTFNPSVSLAVLCSNVGELTAAAFAKVCRYFAWCRIEGHDDLQSLCQALGLSQAVAGALLLGSYRSNYSANGRFSQVMGA